MQAVTVHLLDTIYSVTRNHFKQVQRYRYQRSYQRPWFDWDTRHPYYDLFLDRLVILIEFLKRQLNKSVSWCLKVYRMRFQQFEAVRELRKCGIAVPNEQCAEVAHWITIRKAEKIAMRRWGGTGLQRVLRVKREEDGWTKKREENFIKHYQKYQEITGRAYASNLEVLSQFNDEL